MIKTFSQGYNLAIPPAVGSGSGIALYKSPKFNLTLVDKYGLNVNSSAQYGNQNSLYYNVDVHYPDGTLAPNGSDYETGLKNPVYTFTYEKNTGAFNGSPQRNYSLVFKVHETNPASSSSGQYNVYHNEAEISSVSGVLDGTLLGGGARNRTGTIDINLTLSNNSFYRVNKFEIYTGASSSFSIVTGTGAGANLLKSITAFDQKANYTLTIKDGEQPSNGNYYFYKILPYDDFGSGVSYTGNLSGLMYSVESPAFTVNNITGKNFVMINDGNYVITTYHSGNFSGTGYSVLDRVLNISGNIISGGWYNVNAGDDFTQNSTQYFKTIKYLAQTIDGTGNVSSREILITDNSTSRTGISRTGIIYSEYAVSDNSQSSQFLVSGSGYGSGSGSILLLAKVNYPTGQYKLLRTIM